MEIGENESSPLRQRGAGVLLPTLPTLSLGACITGNNATACWKPEKEKPREIVDNKLFPSSLGPVERPSGLQMRKSRKHSICFQNESNVIR